MIDAEILVEALEAQAERYRSKARDLHHIAERKMSRSLENQAEGFCSLALRAEQIRDQIKEGS